ncbi:MAG: ParB/RepB/Spo0J family partition protein [Planctomycetaceae bacterium]|nr:MAG: ParB/RepB/Spo0J family partition protein [Planctomycetaceae bacterium]
MTSPQRATAALQQAASQQAPRPVTQAPTRPAQDPTPSAPAATDRDATAHATTDQPGTTKPTAPSPTASPTVPSAISAPTGDEPATSGKCPATIVEIAVDQIDPNPFQPRRDFNPAEIASLAESLKRHEQLQPVLVRRVGRRYQLISGERRLRATMHAGRPTVRAEIRDADDRLVAELAIVENMQRKDLNPVEKALSFKRYIDEHQCKQEILAQRLGLDRSTVANLMRLLELPQAILDAIHEGTLTAGHARALLPIGEEDEQLALAKRIQAEGWSVRMVEAHVTELLRDEDADDTDAPGPGGKRNKRTVTPHIESLQNDLRHQLGTKVEIRQTSQGKGKITIHFTSADEFERLQGILSDQSIPRLRMAG